MARTESEFPATSVRRARAADGVRTLTTASGVVDVYSGDHGFVVAVTGRYAIQIIKEQATMTTVILMRRALEDLAERYEKFGYLGVIEPGAQLRLAADIKAGFNAIVKRYSPRFTGAAIVFEKTGFHATAVRSVVTAINFASRASHPNHVFADLREGVSWLSQLTPPEPTAAGLLQIIQQLRLSKGSG